MFWRKQNDTAELERKSMEELEKFFALVSTTASGIQASPVAAMKCPAVLAGVRIRCETIGSLSLKIYERSGEAKEPATDHPLYHLFHARPNPWTSSSQLVMALERDCITHGAGYALAVRGGESIRELHRLKPESVTVEYSDSLEPTYSVAQKTGAPRKYSWREILHVPTFDGLSVLRESAEAIGLTIAMEKHFAGIMGNAARPAGVIKLKNTIKSETLTRLRESWKALHTKDNAGGTAILEEGAEFQPFTFSSVDMEFLAMRGFQIIEIARALGTPPNMLFDFSRATWSNAEEASQSFLSITLLPRTVLWQDAINRLLDEDEQKTHFAEFNVDSLVKADLAARYAAYAQAIAARILNPNEVRAKENMPPYEGGDEFMNPNISTQIPPPVPRERPRAVAA